MIEIIPIMRFVASGLLIGTGARTEEQHSGSRDDRDELVAGDEQRRK